MRSEMILFENPQWAVDDWGLASKVPPSPMAYEIAATRLLEIGSRGDGPEYEWPEHMAEKTWVDIELFLEAYAKALELHAGKYEGTVDRDMMDRSIKAARHAARAR